MRVTPRAGVWIEMMTVQSIIAKHIVTPRAGVWIEIYNVDSYDISSESLPVRECGLKFICARLVSHR